MLLKGKNAIITGARSGIGQATVELFAQSGANVWACARKYDETFENQLAEMCEKYQTGVKPVYFDMSDEVAVKAAIKSIIDEKKSIDILVNSAGIVGENRLFHMTTLAEMRKVFEVNFFSQMLVTQYISRIMCRQKSGSIVNISSVTGIDGDPAQLEYSASKAAMINATKKLAIELGSYGIRVNSVAPGLTDTKMLDSMNENIEHKMLERSIMGRRANPSEIANAVLFFASDMSSFVTGQTLRVDGGVL